MADTPQDKEYLDALVLLYSGMKCTDNREYDDAIERFTIALKILEKRPDSEKMYVTVLSLRAGAYKGKGDSDRARADYDRAIALQPNHAHAYMGRADLYERIGERSCAMADYRKALDVSPDMLPQFVEECKQALKRLDTVH